MPSYKDEKTGKWFVSFYFTDNKGKRVRKMKRGFNLKREADKWEREFLTSDHPDEATMTTLIQGFVKSLENSYNQGNIRLSTLVTYKQYVNAYIIPYWSGVIVSRVQPKDVEDWLTKLVNTPQKTAGKRVVKWRIDAPPKERFSSTTVNASKALLSRIFEYGKRNYALKTNPVKEIDSLKKFSNDTRAKFWTIEQYATFRNALKREDIRAMFDIIYFAGLRIGEAMALTPSDITPKYINVSKTLIIGESHCIGKPKTKSSIRKVAIPRFLYESLQGFIKQSNDLEDDQLLFCFAKSTARECLNRIAREKGLPRISPHILRHSYASNILQATNNYVLTSSLLGHSNPQITLSIYAHLLPNSEQPAMDALEKLNPAKIK